MTSGGTSDYARQRHVCPRDLEIHSLGSSDFFGQREREREGEGELPTHRHRQAYRHRNTDRSTDTQTLTPTHG